MFAMCNIAHKRISDCEMIFTGKPQMYYRPITVFLSALCLISGLFQITDVNAAQRGELLRLRWEGYHKCKELEGTPSWHAVATGLLNDDTIASGHFRLRTCFVKQAACEQFISRIRHHIQGIDQLWQAKCYYHS